MTTPTNKGYSLHVERADGAWIVRVYKKTFFIKRRVSSDWFLDERQALEFARKVAGELADQGPLEILRRRKPGWTFHRPK